MKLRLSKRSRSLYFKWCMAFLIGLSLMLPNAVITLAADPSMPEVTPVLLANTDSVGYLTQSGQANADIYISSTASDLEIFAGKEFKDIVKKVSGAELKQTIDLTSQIFHIILGTPDSLPEILNLFPDDLVFLADSDGFAIRKIENKIYIIGTEAKGVLNGVYDFLEETTGSFGLVVLRSWEHCLIFSLPYQSLR